MLGGDGGEPTEGVSGQMGGIAAKKIAAKLRRDKYGRFADESTGLATGGCRKTRPTERH